MHALQLDAAGGVAWRLAPFPLHGGGFVTALLQVSLVYYLGAFLLHFVVPQLAAVHSIQVGSRRPGQVTQEVLNSPGAILVKAAVLTVVERLHAAGIGKMYSGWPQTWPQWGYILLTIVALDYLHDTWFYWTHRLLHWKPLYRHVHYLHHRSTVPTAFAGYSFHVAEAALVFANEIIVVFLFPIHVGLHRAYHLFTTLIHLGGHAGYEIAPLVPSLEALLWAAASAGAPARGLNTVKHHDMHHRFPTRHFSLYFTHWDRWCGTQHPLYVHTDLWGYVRQKVSHR